MVTVLTRHDFDEGNRADVKSGDTSKNNFIE